MGGSKKYIESGGFTEYEYEQIGTTTNGIKIINKVASTKQNTPMYSNTPNAIYSKTNKESELVDQVTLYNGRVKQKDIDTEHIHKNPTNKRMFYNNEIHVHDYINGIRQKDARKPSKKERRFLMIARYGRTK